MNKFVTWIHNRSKPIQIVIKLALTLLVIAALTGIVVSLVIRVLRWIFIVAVIATFAWMVYQAISEIIEDHS